MTYIAKRLRHFVALIFSSFATERLTQGRGQVDHAIKNRFVESMMLGEHVVFTKEVPLEDKIIPAAAVVKALAGGVNVHLTGAVIKETVNASGLNVRGDLILENCITAKIILSHSRMHGRIWIDKCVFMGGLWIDRTTFDAKVSIMRVLCRRGIRAERAQFVEGLLLHDVRTRDFIANGLNAKSIVIFEKFVCVGSAQLRHADLHILRMTMCRFGPRAQTRLIDWGKLSPELVLTRSGLDMRHARLVGETEIQFLTVHYVAYMSGMHVGGEWTCTNSSFGPTFLALAKFESAVVFMNCTFAADAFLDGVSIGENLVLTVCRFANYAKFSGVRVGGQVNFEACQFEARATFDSISVGQNLSISLTVFGDEARFIGAEIVGEATLRGVQVSGAAIFDRMTVGGALRFRGIELPSVLSNPLLNPSLANSEAANDAPQRAPLVFKGDVSLRGLRVSADTVFDYVIVSGFFHIDDGRFGSNVTFHNVHYIGRFAFERNSVAANLALGGFTVDGDKASFNATSVGGQLLMPAIRISGQLRLSNVAVGGVMLLIGGGARDRSIAELIAIDLTVESELRLADVVLSGKATFKGALFKSDVTFDRLDCAEIAMVRSDARGNVNLRGIEVRSGDADFESSVVAGHFTMSGSHVSGSLLLEHVRIARELDVSDCRVAGNVSLRDATSGRLSLSAEPAANGVVSNCRSLDLTGCTYERVDAPWKDVLEKQVPFSRQPYVQLERTFRVMGEDQLADDVYLMGRRKAGSREKSLVRQVGNLLQRFLFGYGVKPLRPVIFAIGLPVLASVAIAGIPGFARPTAIQSSSYDCKSRPDYGSALWLTLRDYMPFTVEPAGTWIISDCNLGNTSVKLGILAIALRLSGLLLIPLAIAAVTGLLKYVGSR